MKEQAIAIVTEMVNKGYKLFDETIEQFCERMSYDVEMLTMFKERFEKFLNN